ncbi:MAG: YihY/virulence factor BrkB family protein [Chitinophagales bacterium]
MISYYLKIFYKAIKKFPSDEPMEYASSIGFYTIFSLPAILVIAVYVASVTYEDELVRQNLMEQIQTITGPQSAVAVDKILSNAGTMGDDFWTKAFGLGVLIFSATTVFVSLQDGLNKIWRIKAKPNKEVISFFINRLLSLAMAVSFGFLLLVTLVLDTVIAILNSFITDLLSGAAFFVITGINLLFSFGVITVMFAIIFKVLPDAVIKWKDVWAGAFVTTLLFTIGKFLIGFYLANSPISTTYGAAGSLVLLLVWVYYSSLIVLFGAEFTYTHALERGHKVIPKKHAVVVKETEGNTSTTE